MGFTMEQCDDLVASALSHGYTVDPYSSEHVNDRARFILSDWATAAGHDGAKVRDLDYNTMVTTTIGIINGQGRPKKMGWNDAIKTGLKNIKDNPPAASSTVSAYIALTVKETRDIWRGNVEQLATFEVDDAQEIP